MAWNSGKKDVWTEAQLKHNSDKAKERWAEGKYNTEAFKTINVGRVQSESQKSKVAAALSKDWEIISPDGTITIVNNLRQFAISKGLDQGNLSRGSHKGWKAKKV